MPAVKHLAACAFVVTLAFGLAAHAMAADKAPGLADAVVIDAMAADTRLELPPVTFLHDLHTKALAALKKDCAACHLPTGRDAASVTGVESAEGESAGAGTASSYIFIYRDADKRKGAALKDLFHTSCIGCHADLAGTAQKSGPQAAECRKCHVGPGSTTGAATGRASGDADAWRPMGFDKVLHFKHIASAAIPSPTIPEGDPKTNCAACHHVYDAAAKKLIPGKGKEDSCRACHMLLPSSGIRDEIRTGGKAQALQSRLQAVSAIPADRGAEAGPGELVKTPTLPQAAHASCVNCHQTLAVKQQPDRKTGPVNCAGCHSGEAQAKYATEAANTLVSGSIPRLERGQPDAVLLLPLAADKNAQIVGSMRPVSFAHKTHEAASPDCRSCHHKKITACTDCHSLEGRAEGAFVNLAQAMHTVDSSRSCAGCHARQTQKASCAGCHSAMPVAPAKGSCASCHSGLRSGSPEQAPELPKVSSLMKLGKEERTRLAAAEIARREQRRALMAEDRTIPETVSIGILSAEYEAATLPHKKIVKTLFARQSNSTLAKAFHAEAIALCQGCHHNSPVSQTPPKCASCHAVNIAQGASDASGERPTLKAAYHLQCMTCHARMDVKPAQTECAGCHKPRVQ